LVSSPSRSFSQSGAFTPADQTLISAGTTRPLAMPNLVVGDLDDLLARMDPHAQAVQLVERGLLEAGRQGRQHGGRRLDQVELDVALGVYPVEPVSDELARRVV
jgi:hypothetical protein